MRKTILFFAAAVLLSMASVYAQGGTTGPLTWEINDGTLTISGEGEMPDYPYAITPWYDYKNDIHILIIERGVTRIGSLAFGHLKNLTSVSIANTVLTLREGAFFRCTTLPSITIPDGLRTIKTYAFRDCSSLNSIILSKTVEEIDLSAFDGCFSLTSIEVANANTNYASENGILFNKDKTVLFFYPAGKSGGYTIPNNVVAIGNGAFRDCTKLTSVAIPNSVTSIGEAAFSFCTSLTSLKIPNSVTSIGTSTFFDCTNLTSVTIPSSVTSIGYSAFYSCHNLKKITNLNPVPVNIEYNVFSGVDCSACTLEVPLGSVAAYEEAKVWKEFNIVGINVGITLQESLQLSFYPNPTTGVLNLTQETINNEQLTINNIEIFDIYGKKHHLIPSSSHHLINISHLPAGLYFIKVYTEKGVVVEKVIKN